MPPRQAKELAKIRIAESLNGNDVCKNAFDFEQSKPQMASKRPRLESSSTEPEEPVINIAMLLISVKTNENISDEWSRYILDRSVKGLSRMGKKSL